MEDEKGVQETSQVSSSGHSETDDAINRKKKKTKAEHNFKHFELDKLM